MFIGKGKQLVEPRKNFTIRLSDKEHEQAERDAKSNNMKLSDYMRYLVLHGGRVDTAFVYDRRDLIRQIAGLCNNYNQMTKTANSCGYVLDGTMEIANGLLAQIKELLQEVMNKWQ